MISFFQTEGTSDQRATKEQLQRAAEMLRDADAVLVGVGSGMSSAAGFNHYRPNAAFREHFADYIEEYGFQGMFQGYYHLFSSPEEQWAYYSRYIGFMLNQPAARPYLDLRELLRDKPYFVLTTNGDTQVPKAFPEENIFLFQGDFRYLQCGQPCHDELWESEPFICRMIAETRSFRVPSDTLPRCPECGRLLTPWVREETFLQGRFWEEQQARYQAFVARHQHQRLLLLELGVGEMTPSIIKLPFWRLAAGLENASYVSVNLAKSAPPAQLGDRALALADDLAHFLKELLEVRQHESL